MASHFQNGIVIAYERERMARRETVGYSMRERAQQGTGLAFLAVLAFPIVAAIVILGPAGALQLFSPALDLALAGAGGTSLVASTTGEVPSAAAPPTAQLPARDWAVKDGHFFTQTNGQPFQTSATGFLVSNAGGIAFWAEFRRLGGESHLGYPLTSRFPWRGFTVQVFQRGVLQGTPGGEIAHVNVMDELTADGKDNWLSERRQMPRPLPANYGLPGEPVAARLALLSENPAIASRYHASPDSLGLFGLPTSPATDMGQYVVTMRTQRSALHLWKTDGPWGKAGEVTVANTGEIALEAGLFTNAPIQPEPAPTI